MKRLVSVLAAAVAALMLSAGPAVAFSGAPPAGMTSSCSATRVDAGTVHQQGVLRYADGSAAAGWTLDVLWRQERPMRLDWAGGAAHLTSAADGSWSVTYALSGAATSEVSVIWKQGSKQRMTLVNSACPIP